MPMQVPHQKTEADCARWCELAEENVALELPVVAARQGTQPSGLTLHRLDGKTVPLPAAFLAQYIRHAEKFGLSTSTRPPRRS